MIDKEVQTVFSEIIIQPEIRQNRNTTEECKDAIATVSYRAGISIPKARVAVKAVCEKLYDHVYHLEPPPPTTVSDGEGEPLPKKVCTDGSDKNRGAPRSQEEYKAYKKVLPSAKVVNLYKHKKALYQEILAAKSLIDKAETTKVTLHYDTTSRSRIDGEWPCLILNFMDDVHPENSQFLRLRPLHFAFENREQIVKLVIETFNRLSAAVSGLKSAKELWEQVAAFMTDAVSKNLKVEIEVAAQLGSNHIPYHLLCKSHTCEKLDESNIQTLSIIENRIGLRKQLEQREPRLKSYLRSSKSIVAGTVIKALLKLVAREGDGKTTSIADDFDLILEEDKVYKTYSLYKERRFSKLGYSAGSIYDCLPQFQKALERTNKNNLLIRSCRLYLESDFIKTALKALATFTYCVTMQFLNCVERCDQNQLVEILPILHNDLENKILRSPSLEPYHVPWTHVDMEKQKPTTELDKFILDDMCTNAAKGVKLQCSREYWDTHLNEDGQRASSIQNLNIGERKNLPTENLVCERYLPSFGLIASESARHSNKKFKEKRIRDDLMFNKGEEEASRSLNTYR